MPKKIIYSILLFCFFFSCAKKETPVNSVVPPPPPKTPTIKFVFVNKIGFRNDSVGDGKNDTVFQGVCWDIKYYDKLTNKSHLEAKCYNRNYPKSHNTLSDSIVFGFNGIEREYKANTGSFYQFTFDLIWKNRKVPPYTTKAFRFHNLGYPGIDSVKVLHDTVIKFIWPDDTASGRYLRGIPF